MVLPLLMLLACDHSKVPDDALWFSVTVTGIGPDECHPGDTTGYQEVFDYAVTFSGSSASIYVDGQPFAQGVQNACDVTYETVVIGEDLADGSGSVKWQLSGTARYDRGTDSCVEGDGDWVGTETFTIVDADVPDDSTITVGCGYPMSTVGTFESTGG